MKKLIVPNDIDGFVLSELCQRLKDCQTVRIAFGGTSMLPMISGDSDVIELQSVGGDEPLRDREVYLFVCNGKCVVHRLMKQRRGSLRFRGDNCVNSETVSCDAVLARLVAVHHSDGSVDRCDSLDWRRRSLHVVARRSLLNVPFRSFSRRQRLWQRWVYFVGLIVLMWAPLGGIGLNLNNFVFGIRLDHLLHASVYIPCVLYLVDFQKLSLLRNRFRSWIVAILISLTTEFVQLLLPYRGFDINDMAANFIGVTAGWLIIVTLWHKKHRTK